MMTLVIFSILVLLNIVNKIVFKDRESKPILILSFVLLFFIFYINVANSIDYNNYLEYYNYYGNNLITKLNYYGVEYSFGFLCYIFNHLGLQGAHLISAYYIFSIIFLYKSICLLDNSKKDYYLFITSLIAFCLVLFLTITRQFLSISILFYSIVLFFKGHKKKSIIYYIVSVFFHHSAIFCFPLYLLLNFKKKIPKPLKIILPIACYIVNKTGIIRSIAVSFLQLFNGMYLNYITNSSSNTFENTGIVRISMFILYLVQFFVSNNKENNEECELLENGEMIYFSLTFLLSGYGFMIRFSYFFIIFQCFIFISLYNKFQSKKNKDILYPLLFIFTYVFTMYILTINNFN